MPHHDIVVIGASLGGVETLSDLARQLPSDLPASVFVVLHTTPESPGVMGQILDRSGPLKAAAAKDGEPIERGRIYVAPPDRHLLVQEGRVRLSRGPRENRCRPAADPLFRSAATTYGPRVIGVVLTGLLDDGAAGIVAIKRCGGITVAQDPADAKFPGMPGNAVATGMVDYQVKAAELGETLARLVRTPAGDRFTVPEHVEVENRYAHQAATDHAPLDRIGMLTPLSCPDCGGPLWELNDDDDAEGNGRTPGGNAPVKRYRCTIGHAFGPNTLLYGHDERIEAAIWAALRAMEQRVELLHRMARNEQAGGRERVALRFQQQAEDSKAHADRLRELLTGSAPAAEDTAA